MNKYFPVMALAFALAIVYLPSCQKNSQIFGADDQDLSTAIVGDRGDSTHCDSLHPHHPHHPFDSTGGHPLDTLGHGPHHPIDTTGGGIHPHHPIDTTGNGGGHHPVDTTGHGGGHPGGPHGGGHGGGHGHHGG